MNSSFYVALALLVAAAIADDSRSKKEAIYNPYGQIADANKYLATPGYNTYNNYQQQLSHNGYQPAVYSAYNQQYYQQQQQPHQRYPYTGDTATGYYHQQRYSQQNYPYGGYQQYSGFQQYPYNSNQQYPYNGNQQYSYNGNQQYGAYQQQNPYSSNQQYGAYQQQYPYGYQNAYGHQQNSFGYNNAYNSNQVLRQAPAYPSSGAQPISPPVPHPFYHVQGTYYPTEINKPAPPAVGTVNPKKTYK